MAMNAPCPSDNCPFRPVSTVRPPAATARYATDVS